ncbi:hypothetical protein C1G86_1387 [Dehalococcoides mccartyi]|uniref:Uncharacterized protein n=1 Tax=Dehalococcoides mccartyi TaxID=61435 RepID=A0A328ENF8_9CHLR|nr:hypothetical protein C1G86_1387 [Dehalococcoides mccartyi]
MAGRGFYIPVSLYSLYKICKDIITLRPAFWVRRCVTASYL